MRILLPLGRFDGWVGRLEIGVGRLSVGVGGFSGLENGIIDIRYQ